MRTNKSGYMSAGRVLKSLKPGAPGTKRWLKKYGRRLVRVRSTTVEIVVDKAFWDPDGYVDLSSIRQSI
jgi:hypothetical protein